MNQFKIKSLAIISEQSWFPLHTDAFRGARLQSPRHCKNMCSCGYSSQRHWLLASIFPAGLSARAVPTGKIGTKGIWS